MNGRELIEALNLIEKEKHIDKEIIFEAIKTSLETACKKNYGTSENIRVDINRDNGDVKVFAQKVVTEEIYDAFLEVSLEDARDINPNYNYGDIVEYEITPKNFGRISAQTAKQIVVQKLREAEREMLYNEYHKKEKDIDVAIVQRVEKKNVIVSLGKMEAVLTEKEQIPGETYTFNKRIKVYIDEVRLDQKKSAKGPTVTVSRRHQDLVKRLFELEVPEVKDGTIEIKGISREAGSRTKIAVYSKDENIDAVGACVGPNGSRVNAIVNELNGEKIDIIPWSEDPKKFIATALNPSKVLAVQITQPDDEEEEFDVPTNAVAFEETTAQDEVAEGDSEKTLAEAPVKKKKEKTAKVVVPDNQLSLAIGKEGQNVRLAARLTGWKIDIKGETQARETDYIDYDEDEDTEDWE